MAALSGRTWRLIMAGAGAAVVGAAVLRRRRRMDFRDASVVITGGSRGLGLELARQLAREGALLSLLARDPVELERARRELTSAGADVLVFPCDVRDRDEIEGAVAAVIAARGRIDVLVNNAGVVQVGPFENLDLRDFQESLDIYAWGPLHLVNAVVPHMKRQGGGRIVNISSIGGLVAVPHLLAYCMGKFALTALSDGLRAELAKDGIRVTTVAPGLMRTGSHVNAYFKGQHRKEYAWFSMSSANPLLSVSVHTAAGRIVDATRYGDARLIITLPASLLHVMNANFPALTAAASKLANLLLPNPAAAAGAELHTGWQCRSRVAPSLMTRLADRAIGPNNEKKVRSKVERADASY